MVGLACGGSAFPELSGPEDEVGMQRLHEPAGVDHCDMGRVLATYRASGLDPSGVFTPFTWWLLGTRRAAALAVVVPWSTAGGSPVPARLAMDPVIGVGGPALP